MVSDNDNFKKLKTFFDEEYHSLRTYARSRIENTTDRDAEDIIQDVAVKVFSRANTASPINNIAGFVYNSIKNKIIDIMRVRKNDVSMEDEMEARLSEFTELFYGKSDNFYSEEMKLELKKAIATLKPFYREIIIAIDFEGYGYKEISDETGIPAGTLMSRRHRALSILSKKLETKRLRNH